MAAVAAGKVAPGVRVRFGSMAPVAVVINRGVGEADWLGEGVGLKVGVGLPVAKVLKVAAGVCDALGVTMVAVCLVFLDETALPIPPTRSNAANTVKAMLARRCARPQTSSGQINFMHSPRQQNSFVQADPVRSFCPSFVRTADDWSERTTFSYDTTTGRFLIFATYFVMSCVRTKISGVRNADELVHTDRLELLADDVVAAGEPALRSPCVDPETRVEVIRPETFTGPKRLAT